jgi:hypothetical protein
VQSGSARRRSSKRSLRLAVGELRGPPDQLLLANRVGQAGDHDRVLRGQRRCQDCTGSALLDMDVRRAVVAHLGGLDLDWPRPVRQQRPAGLPVHLPVLVRAYADPVDVPWVAIHGSRLLGTGGRVTPKHRQRPLREVYRLGPATGPARPRLERDGGV